MSPLAQSTIVCPVNKAAPMQIRPFQSSDESAVIDLWRKCDLVKPWNDPHKDIQRKLAVGPELFLVGLVDGELVATVMAGYEDTGAGSTTLRSVPNTGAKGMGGR